MIQWGKSRDFRYLFPNNARPMEVMATENERLIPSQRGHSIQESDAVDSEEETQVFYPWEMRQLEKGKSSAFGGVFILVNAALGAGLLAFPFAFYSAGGAIEGMAIQLVLLLFIVTSLLILAYVAEKKQVGTYEDVVSVMWGPYMRSAAELCVFLYCFGACVTYLVVIGDQIDDISSAFNYHRKPLQNEWFVDRRFTITAAAVVFILPWLFLRRIGILSYTSFLAVLCCLYIAIIVCVKYFTINTKDYLNDCESPRDVPSSCSRSWPDTFNAIPFLCFGYQCHVSSVPVYAGLKRRNLRVYSVIVVVGMAICLFVYTLTGTFGYLTFQGHSCFNSDILRNYCPSDILINIARGVLAFVMVTSYPILAYCGRTALDGNLLKALRLFKLSRIVAPYERTRWIIEGLVWFVVSLSLAVFVPQISYVINPIGGVAATFLLVYPGMCLMKLVLESRKFSRGGKCLLVVISCIFVAFGMFVLGNSVVYSIMNDFGAFEAS